MAKGDGRVRKTIRLRPDVASAAEDAARTEGSSLSAWVQRAVEQRLGSASDADAPRRRHRVDSESTERRAAVRVLVNPGELAALREAAERAGMTMSEYVRARCCYTEPDWVEVDEGPVMELVRQVKRVGNNVNQIAFRLNAVADHGAPKVAEEMSGELRLCREDLSGVLDAAMSLMAEVNKRRRR